MKGTPLLISIILPALETRYNLVVVLQATLLKNQVALSKDRYPWWTQNDNSMV